MICNEAGEKNFPDNRDCIIFYSGSARCSGQVHSPFFSSKDPAGVSEIKLNGKDIHK